MTGIVLKDDLLAARGDGRSDTELADLRRPVRVVRESVGLKRLMHVLLQHRLQIAIAVDGHGTVTGLVSLEDLLETLLGQEIVDETDTVDDLQKAARALRDRRRAAAAATVDLPASSE